MSILTIEERTLLKSLDCRDKAQAVSVLDDMLTLLPVRSEMFRMVLTLSHKLKKSISIMLTKWLRKVWTRLPNHVSYTI